MHSMIRITLIVLLVSVAAREGLAAQGYDNHRALAGLREAKVYFDINVGEPAKLLTRLRLIETTHDQLVASGISPSIVVGIRGQASNYFTRNDDYVPETDLPVKRKIAARAGQFKAKGFRIEQCSIAAGLQEIEVDDFLPELEIVANGYISMIGYQSNGYAFVPMD